MTQEKIHSLLTENRMSIFGISLIWIFFRHTFFYNSFSFGLFDYLVRIGDSGVDIFMFMSAYGLCFSYQKNSNKIQFYKKRLLRVAPSVFILLFLFAIIDTCLFDASIIKCIHPLYWFNSLYSTYWFIGAILVFYILFPFIYDFLFKSNFNQYYIITGAFAFAIICVTIILLTRISLLYQLVVYTARIPILIIGMLMAIRGIWPQKIILFFLVISLPLVCLLPKDYQRISYGLLAVPVVYYLSLLLDKTPKIIKKLLSFVGVCSLEFYLIHIYLFKNDILFNVNDYIHSELLSSLLVLILVIVLSYVANRLIKTINEVFIKRYVS